MTTALAIMLRLLTDDFAMSVMVRSAGNEGNGDFAVRVLRNAWLHRTGPIGSTTANAPVSPI